LDAGNSIPGELHVDERKFPVTRVESCDEGCNGPYNVFLAKRERFMFCRFEENTELATAADNW
jgi:hypothetical protein